jgi:hypothetical protein
MRGWIVLCVLLVVSTCAGSTQFDINDCNATAQSPTGSVLIFLSFHMQSTPPAQYHITSLLTYSHRCIISPKTSIQLERLALPSVTRQLLASFLMGKATLSLALVKLVILQLLFLVCIVREKGRRGEKYRSNFITQLEQQI